MRRTLPELRSHRLNTGPLLLVIGCFFEYTVQLRMQISELNHIPNRRKFEFVLGYLQVYSALSELCWQTHENMGNAQKVDASSRI